jgi:hypothetical protein
VGEGWREGGAEGKEGTNRQKFGRVTDGRQMSLPSRLTIVLSGSRKGSHRPHIIKL